MANYIMNLKLSASSIIETLVASVIIVIVFTIASMTMNNVIRANIYSDTSDLENHMYKLSYFHEHQKVGTPFYEEYKGWDLNLIADNGKMIIIAKNKKERTRVKKLEKRILSE